MRMATRAAARPRASVVTTRRVHVTVECGRARVARASGRWRVGVGVCRVGAGRIRIFWTHTAIVGVTCHDDQANSSGCWQGSSA